MSFDKLHSNVLSVDQLPSFLHLFLFFFWHNFSKNALTSNLIFMKDLWVNYLLYLVWRCCVYPWPVPDLILGLLFRYWVGCSALDAPLMRKMICKISGPWLNTQCAHHFRLLLIQPWLVGPEREHLAFNLPIIYSFPACVLVLHVILL